VADNETNVVNIGGTEYDPSDLTDQQKYWIVKCKTFKTSVRRNSFS
jgi:hypothetical protein